MTNLTRNEEYLNILKNAAPGKDPLEVIPEHMKWLLNNVFGESPRNHKYDEKILRSSWKNEMAGYIWHKFGVLGYLTCHQTFKPRQFQHYFQGVKRYFVLIEREYQSDEPNCFYMQICKLFVFRIAVKEILREQISLQYCQERIGVPRRMRS